MEKDKTLGQYIRELRLRKKKEDGKSWSQLDLSLAIGWENPSTLSRIENDDVKPTRETLIKIANALKLENDDINTMFQTLGYLELEHKITEKYKEQLAQDLSYSWNLYPYPMLLIQNTGYLTFWNIVAEKFFLGKLDKNSQKLIQNTTHIEILFDKKYGIRENIINWEEFTQLIIGNLYAWKLGPDELEDLAELLKKWEVIDDFKKFWNENIQKRHNDAITYNIPFKYNHPKVGLIHFTISTFLLYQDKRFYVEQFLPSTAEDFRKLKTFDKNYLN